MAIDNYSFEPVNTTESSVPVAEARPVTGTAPGPTERIDDVVEPEPHSASAVMVGCGLAGWVVAGPFLAILTALGGAYAAEHSRGPVGETSRALGRVTGAAGRKAREEHLWCKIKEAFRSFFRSRTCECQHCKSSGNNRR